jgi:hypothetical protein
MLARLRGFGFVLRTITECLLASTRWIPENPLPVLLVHCIIVWVMMFR